MTYSRINQEEEGDVDLIQDYDSVFSGLSTDEDDLRASTLHAGSHFSEVCIETSKHVPPTLP